MQRKVQRDGAHTAGLELDGNLGRIRALIEDGDGEPVVALVELMTGEGACGERRADRGAQYMRRSPDRRHDGCAASVIVHDVCV